MRKTSRRWLLGSFLPALASCLLVCSGAARMPAAASERIALKGYDPVSYFTEGRPEKGSNDFRFAFDDAVYLFKNTEHQAMFAADPEHYAPQYAGFCAGSVALGYKIEADPEAWTIIDGKLFVFYEKQNASEFAKDPQSIIAQANAHWAQVRAEP